MAHGTHPMRSQAFHITRNAKKPYTTFFFFFQEKSMRFWIGSLGVVRQFPADLFGNVITNDVHQTPQAMNLQRHRTPNSSTQNAKVCITMYLAENYALTPYTNDNRRKNQCRRSPNHTKMNTRRPPTHHISRHRLTYQTQSSSRLVIQSCRYVALPC